MPTIAMITATASSPVASVMMLPRADASAADSGRGHHQCEIGFGRDQSIQFGGDRFEVGARLQGCPHCQCRRIGHHLGQARSGGDQGVAVDALPGKSMRRR